MSGLSVPLTVRVGNRHVTREVKGLSFRKEAVGGVRSISLTLARPIDQFDPNLAAFSRVYIYDGRNATTIAEGRLTDPGRGASAASGGQWEMTAFGPVQHASDDTRPLIYVDRSISEGWWHVDVVHPEATVSTSTKPGDASSAAPQGIAMAFPEGIGVNTGSRVVNRYDRVWHAGMKLARYAFTWDSSGTSAQWRVQGATWTDAGAGEVSADFAWDVAGGAVAAVVGTHFPNGRNTIGLRTVWNGGAATTGGDTWAWFEQVAIRTLLLSKDGGEITTGYTTDTVLAHEVVADLLGRTLPQFDGANAVIDATSFEINQMAYPDGVTPAKILEDLMAIEPAYRWTTGPSNVDGKYAFRWEQWPTTVRYEVTVNDGGSFPSSGQELYNQVSVRWRDVEGNVRSIVRTMTCRTLDDAGIVRRWLLDLGDEIASQSMAERMGDNFLAEHNVPKNAGTLNISRPIRDLVAGRLVQPWEIQPGELIRVTGVESYTDALNASSSDGQTVFRIWSTTYASDSNTASLELDSDARTTSAALAKLLSARTRKR